MARKNYSCRIREIFENQNQSRIDSKAFFKAGFLATQQKYFCATQLAANPSRVVLNSPKPVYMLALVGEFGNASFEGNIN